MRLNALRPLIARAIESGEFTPTQAIDLCANAIAEREKDVGAFVTLDLEGVRKAALAPGLKDKPLRGLPVALKDALESNKVKLAVKAGAEGRLFGSVKTGDVADAVKAAGLGDLDKRKIHITSPIKSVGEHEATVRLRDDLTAVITLVVVAAK